MNSRILAAICFATISTVSYADMSECMMKKAADDKWDCMASYSGSGTFCDKISNWERRQFCTRRVIEKQRKNRQ